MKEGGIMKPLSPQTLEKKYLMLGLPREKTDLLHDYFLCFCHLYGVISLRQAWAVFRHYEGPRFMLKKDFMAFSGIVQREPGLPYSVLDIKEVYPDEPSNNPEDRLIANNRLLSHGYYKFAQLSPLKISWESPVICLRTSPPSWPMYRISFTFPRMGRRWCAS